MATCWAQITDIPIEVLVNRILPFCEGKDVLSLGCTNKLFALVANDAMFWRGKLAADYNFTGLETTRTSGWKLIYQKLRNPRIFVWGYAAFLFFGVMRVFIRSLMHSNASDHPETGSVANLGYHSFRRQPSRMFLFQSSFAFQVFVWSA